MMQPWQIMQTITMIQIVSIYAYNLITYLQLSSFQAFIAVATLHQPPAAGQFEMLVQLFLGDQLSTRIGTGLWGEATTVFMVLKNQKTKLLIMMNKAKLIQFTE